MRFIHLYLIGYFVLVVGAVLALWQAGVLARVSGSWLAIGMLIVFGLGIMLAEVGTDLRDSNGTGCQARRHHTSANSNTSNPPGLQRPTRPAPWHALWFC